MPRKFGEGVTPAQNKLARDLEAAQITTYSQAIKAFQRDNETQIDTWTHELEAKRQEAARSRSIPPPMVRHVDEVALLIHPELQEALRKCITMDTPGVYSTLDILEYALNSLEFLVKEILGDQFSIPVVKAEDMEAYLVPSRYRQEKKVPESSSTRRILDHFLKTNGYIWDEDRELLHTSPRGTAVTLLEAMHTLASEKDGFAQAWLVAYHQEKG
jgi:hypothetical protein